MIGARWGVTADEVTRAYPCDALVERPTLEAWRGVTVSAPPETVWAWLIQVRLAPYSYDLIDNLGRRSPRTMLALPDPAPGDRFSTAARRSVGRVVSLEHGVHLTALIMGVYLSYVLTPGPAEPGVTRLVLKVTGDTPAWQAGALCLGDLPMARRQLLTFKRLAEGAVG